MRGMMRTEYDTQVSDEILKTASKTSGIPPKALMNNRKHHVIYWRGLAMSAARYVFSVSYSFLGATFDYKDHTSVMHTVKSINNDINNAQPRSQILKDYNSMTLAMLNAKNRLKKRNADLMSVGNAKDFITVQDKKVYEDTMRKALKVAQSIEKAEVPDWNRIIKQGEVIGADAVVQAFKAWIDSNRGKVVPQRKLQ